MCVLRIIPAIQSGSNAPANRWKAANDFDDSESGLMEGAARVRDATGPDQFLDCFDRCLQCSESCRSHTTQPPPASCPDRTSNLHLSSASILTTRDARHMKLSGRPEPSPMIKAPRWSGEGQSTSRTIYNT